MIKTEEEADKKIDEYFYNKIINEFGFDKHSTKIESISYKDTIYYFQLQEAFKNGVISKLFYDRRIKELEDKYENT